VLHRHNNQQPTDSKAEDNINWKVVGWKSSNPLRKAATRGDKDGEKAAAIVREVNISGPSGSSTQGGDGGSHNETKTTIDTSLVARQGQRTAALEEINIRAAA
jgi:hypothetical protein